VLAAVPTRRRTSITLLIFVLGALTGLSAAGSATAGLGLQITINGEPLSTAGPQVTASLTYDGSDQWLLSVTNSSSNPAGDNITEIDGAVGQAGAQQGIVINRVSAQSTNSGDTFVVSGSSGISLLFSSAPVNACFMPQAPQATFACPTLYGGFGAGSTEVYTLISTDAVATMPLLDSIDVKMSMGACTHKNGPRQLASASDDCALPGVTKITRAKVGTRAASFGYTAKHATKYVCELLYENRVVHRTSCGASKTYTGLKSGTYFFLVWGGNRAGVAQKATVYGFKAG
jgi:hypothetical protein